MSCTSELDGSEKNACVVPNSMQLHQSQDQNPFDGMQRGESTVTTDNSCRPGSYHQDDAATRNDNEENLEKFDLGPSVALTKSRASESALGALSIIESRMEDEAEEEALQEIPPPPNGGFIAWLQVVAAWLALFNSWGYVNSWGVFQDYFTQQLAAKGVSASTIGWVGSCQAFFGQGLALFGGRLVDMGYQRQVLISGVFFTVFGVMMMSLSSEFYQIMLAQGVCVAIGNCCLFISTVTLVAQYFSTKRATAIGIATSGSSMGGIIFPIMARNLIERVGYAWAFRTIGFLMLGLLSVPVFVSKPRVPPRVTGPLIDWPSFKDLTFMMTSLGFLLGAGALFSYMFYVNSYATATNVSSNIAPYLVTVLNAASTFGRILPNLIADKLGVMNVLIPCFTVCTILLICWIRVTSTAGEVVLAAVFGGFSGTYLSLTAPTLASLTPQLDKMGSRTGLGLFISAFGFLLAGPATGALIEGTNYLHAQIFSFCLCIGTIFVFTFARLRISTKLFRRV